VLFSNKGLGAHLPLSFFNKMLSALLKNGLNLGVSGSAAAALVLSSVGSFKDYKAVLLRPALISDHIKYITSKASAAISLEKSLLESKSFLALPTLRRWHLRSIDINSLRIDTYKPLRNSSSSIV